MEQLHHDYQRIASALRFIEAQREEQPGLDVVAAHVGLSPAHFQRVFTRWAGVSPKRFLQFLTLEHARAQLEASSTVLDAAFEAGLSGPSRLHDLCVQAESVTPGEIRQRGASLELRYGFHATPFGRALVATTPRGLCWLAFVEDDTQALAELQKRWPKASLTRDAEVTAKLAHDALSTPINTRSAMPQLDLRGTTFQLQVWRALLCIPPGHLTTYGHIARAIGKPGSARAVGGAVGANPVAVLIPCHRVIRQSGAFDGYRWGRTRKAALLGWEGAHTHA